MVIAFLQTLVGPAYDWYLSLPTSSITSFTDIEDTFLDLYSYPVSYHTLIIEFMHIHLQKNEKMQNFIAKFRHTL